MKPYVVGIDRQTINSYNVKPGIYDVERGQSRIYRYHHEPHLPQTRLYGYSKESNRSWFCCGLTICVFILLLIAALVACIILYNDYRIDKYKAFDTGYGGQPGHYGSYGRPYGGYSNYNGYGK